MAEPARAPRQGVNMPEFSVSELSSAIKRTLEGAYGYVRLRGEISGFRGVHASGHAYFGLKDDKAKIEAVIWRTTLAGLRVKPAEGLEVIATGRITTYPGSSRYQIVIDALEPAGVGALMALLEERKKKLAAEGLFNDAAKRPLPFLPRVVGIITSPTGAVIRDMLAGFQERFPTRVVLWPVRVQGDTCAAEVSAAIRGFNAIAPGGPLPRPDVLIVARGGGSLEDLWGFNDEAVVRATAGSRIPVISAVGHETDWTLIDLAADARAPTPTKAAEWAVPKYTELIEQTAKLALRLTIGARRALEAMRTHWRAAARGLPRRGDLLALPRQRFDAVERRLGRALIAGTRAHALHLTRAATRLHPRLLNIRLTRMRERLGAGGQRLDQALSAGTRAHALRLARTTSRLHPRLLQTRLGRMHERLDLLSRRATASLARLAGPRRARLARLAGRLAPDRLQQRLERCAERLEALHARARQNVSVRLARKRALLDAGGKLLASLSYHGVLQRGFALVRDSDGRTLRSVEQTAPGHLLDIELADGHVGAQAVSRQPAARSSSGEPTPAPAASGPSASGKPAPARGSKSGGGPGNGQGSLF